MTPVIGQSKSAAFTMPENSCIVQECRLSHANLYEPAPDLKNELKYSAVLLISKQANISAIQAATAAAINIGIEKKWNNIKPPNIKMALMDGDIYAAAKPEKRQAYVGNWYINCKQNPDFGKPILLNERRTRSVDKSEIQSGDYAVAVIELIPYRSASGDGITAVPKSVRKLRTGERFTKGLTESDALAALGGELTEEEYASLPQVDISSLM
jgi:hypothetical protein